MTDHSLAATKASNSQEELEALIKQVTELSQMSLDMTRLCIDVQGKFLPHTHFFSESSSTAIVPGIALTRQAFDMARACLDLRCTSPNSNSLILL